MIIRKILLICLSLLLLVSAISSKSDNINIVDVSWPNCQQKLDYYNFGIVGVNGGRDFTKNPCLANQITNFRYHDLYINSGYPGPSYGVRYKNSPLNCNNLDNNCLAYNYGYNAAKYSIDYAVSQNAHSSNWWIDIETANSWTNDVLSNREFIAGAINAIKSNILFAKVGIYSTYNQWQQIMGPWNNNLDSWLGTGSNLAAIASSACKYPGFTGAKIIYSQFTPNKYLDYNIKCPN